MILRDFQEAICRVIASLPVSEDSESSDDKKIILDLINQKLEPLFSKLLREHQSQQQNDQQTFEKSEQATITPLILACDRNHVPCLEYFNKFLISDNTISDPNNTGSTTKNILIDVIGKPLDPSKDEHNTAMHYAAMSGCSAAIRILKSMGKSDNDNNNNSNGLLTVFKLGTVRNTHGDTPLMMAAASGHVEFCKTWYNEVLQEETNAAAPMSSSSTSMKVNEQLKEMFQAQNDSGDTCLSLACCHGHKATVDFLLNACGVMVQLEQSERCKTSLQHVTAALQSNPQLLEKHKDKHLAVKECVATLEKRLEQQAEAAAMELLLLQEHQNEAGKSSVHQQERIEAKHKPTKKKKAKWKSKFRLPDDVGNEAIAKQTDISTIQSHLDETNSLVCLTTLDDGKVAVRVPGTIESSSSTAVITNPAPTILRSSPNEMFRQRFQEGSSFSISEEVDQIMDALCLDVSMLLYTPHGMALNLSPSQLDAIQAILEKQLEAVRKARDIKRRLHETTITAAMVPSNPPPT